MHGNEIHTPHDRQHKAYPSPNPHINASNSVKREVIWTIKITLSYLKYPSSESHAILDISEASR